MTIKKLAETFHGIVRRELTEHLEAIDAENAVRDDCCATHDHCDANMLMVEAFETALGREIDLMDGDDVRLWDGAWDLAIANGFNKEWSQ